MTHCQIHGTRMILLGHAWVCPHCLEEAASPIIDRMSFFEARRQAQADERRRSIAEIPAIYREADLDAMRLPVDQASSFQKLVEVMKRFCDDFETFRVKRSGLLFVGDAGVGKTHLACAMGNRLLNRGYSVRYVSLPAFTMSVRATYSSSEPHESVRSMIDRMCAVDFLILDEIDLHGASMSDFQMIYEIINARYSAGNLPMVVTSNRSKAFLINDLGDRIVSRIVDKTVEIQFKWPTFRVAKSFSQGQK